MISIDSALMFVYRELCAGQSPAFLQTGPQLSIRTSKAFYLVQARSVSVLQGVHVNAGSLQLPTEIDLR